MSIENQRNIGMENIPILNDEQMEYLQSCMLVNEIKVHNKEEFI